VLKARRFATPFLISVSPHRFNTYNARPLACRFEAFPLEKRDHHQMYPSQKPDMTPDDPILVAALEAALG